MEHLPAKGFKPQIWVYLCDCCLGIPDIEKSLISNIFPTNVGHMAEMCIGNSQTNQVSEAFANGADGVLLCGCQVGNCRTADNVQMLRIIHHNQKLLKEMGVEAQRLGQVYLAPDCPRTLRASVESFIEKIEKMGPVKRTKNSKRTEA